VHQNATLLHTLGLHGAPIVSERTPLHPRKPKPRPRRPIRGKRPPDPTGPVRRSIWLERALFDEVAAQSKLEQRKSSDMIRVLIRRGLVATRGTPPPGTTR